MKNLLIVGARGWGREVYKLALNCKAYMDGEYTVKGFLDSDRKALDNLRGNFPPILCSPEDYTLEENDVFIIAMGDSLWRKHYTDIIASKGGHFISLISDKATVFDNAQIGEGCVIGAFSTISDNVVIGNHVVVHSFCVFGHDSSAGDFSSIESYCFIGGKSKVGPESTMHVRSTLIRHKSIGQGAVVGAGSTVISNVKSGAHVFGCPAKEIIF